LRVPRTLLRALVVGAAAVVTLLPGYAAHAEPTPAEVQSQIDKASNELEDVVETYNGITEQLKTTQGQAQQVSVKVEAAKKQLDQTSAEVQKLSSAALRRSGGVGTVSAVLTAESSDEFFDQISAIRAVNRTQQRDITRFTTAKSSLEAEQTRYNALVAQQTTQQQQLAERKSTIEANIQSLEALKQRLASQSAASQSSASSSSSNSGSNDDSQVPAASGSAGSAVAFARAQLGKPYVWGASGPSSYDCSGLTMAAWSNAGVSLPHNAAMQYNSTAKVSRSALQPGDLVFYRSLGHVAIYIGNGKVIHAPSSGDVVKVSSVDMMTPYGYSRP
jgi:peptidoglycan DL-endopeptidase CwlO